MHRQHERFEQLPIASHASAAAVHVVARTACEVSEEDRAARVARCVNQTHRVGIAVGAAVSAPAPSEAEVNARRATNLIVLEHKGLLLEPTPATRHPRLKVASFPGLLVRTTRDQHAEHARHADVREDRADRAALTLAISLRNRP
eukprot:6203318-Pleurochrysis_carterae.AAC.1